ncbi:MAG: archaellin/type IV pilin N-terminal domain-containing protein [Nanoarchaeota archaeon]
MKKGISPLIATVLLIAFVVLVAGSIYIWSTGYLEKTKERASEEIDVMDATNKIDYTIDDARYISGYKGNLQKIVQGLAIVESNKKKILISITNNGQVEIKTFVIRVVDKDGNSYVNDNFYVDLDVFEHKNVEFEFDSSNLSEIDYVEIIPKVGDRIIESKATKFRIRET